MPDIKQLKKEEMDEILAFYTFIEDYGHIFYDDPKVLDVHFDNILSSIEEIRKIVDDNYSN